MNLLKNVFIIAILAAVAYGVYLVYLSMNDPTPTAPPPGVAEDWGPVNVQMPGSPTAAAPMGLGATDPSASPGFPAALTAMPASPATPPLSQGPGTPSPTAPGNYAVVQPEAAFGGASRNVPDATIPPVGSTESLANGSLAHSGPPAAPITNAANPQVREEFAEFLKTARAKLNAGSWEEVHRVLTTWYASPQLTPEESARLTELLDQVAGTVIYSRQHLMEEPYVLHPGETIQQIAESLNVPWQLLAKINGIRDPQDLRPDQPLKVIRGPFHAVVFLDSHELALYLDDRYAGRFPVGLGTDAQQLEGTYVVKDKVINPTYYAPDGGTIEAEDPRNPLGRRWIGLGGQIGIHGTNDSRNIGRNQTAGSICLSERDIDDVFDILSVGSRVQIRR